MADGLIFLNTSAPLSVIKAFRINLISAGSISLDSTFKARGGQCTACTKCRNQGEPRAVKPVYGLGWHAQETLNTRDMTNNLSNFTLSKGAF
jgi:hypothetical protein